MKSQTKAELSQLLSSYLDGELDEAQVHAVETMLSQNPDAQKELEELSALKNLLASKRPLPPAYSFWTRFSAGYRTTIQNFQNKSLPKTAARAGGYTW